MHDQSIRWRGCRRRWSRSPTEEARRKRGRRGDSMNRAYKESVDLDDAGACPERQNHVILRIAHRKNTLSEKRGYLVRLGFKTGHRPPASENRPAAPAFE